MSCILCAKITGNPLLHINTSLTNALFPQMSGTKQNIPCTFAATHLVVGDRSWLVGMFALHDSVVLRCGGYVDVGHGRLDVDRAAQRQRHQLFGERNDGWQDVLDEVQHLHCTLNTHNT